MPYEKMYVSFKKQWNVSLTVLTLMTALCVTSCKARQVVIHQVDKEIITINDTIRDTTIFTNADSATIRALLHCSQDNELLIKRLSTHQGDNLEINIVANRVNDSTSLLVVDCKHDSLEHVIKIRDRTIRSLRESYKNDVQYLPYKPPWWALTLQGLGILFLIIASFAIYKRIKNIL